MIITDILARNARQYPEDVALVERCPINGTRRELTWKMFDHRANALAGALLAKGIQKGDKVVLLMTNCLDWLPVYFGILKAGAVAVPLNFRFMSDKILMCSEVSEAKVMIFGEEFIDRVRTVKDDLDRTVEWYIFSGPEEKMPRFADPIDPVWAGAMAPPDVEVTVLDDAALYFTSGTTGAPKAVLLTHRNLEFACYAENNHHGQKKDDNFLCIPPLYHTGAKMHWFGNLLVGAKTVLLKGVSPRWILEAVSEERVTIVWLLVPWAHDILNAVAAGDLSLSDYRLEQWRLMHIGAQPVPPSLIEQWLQMFPNHEYDTNYGLTEASGPGCVHLGHAPNHKVGAIGLPGFDWECRIVDRNMEPVPSGEPGELIVRGPGVMKAYYKNEKATRETLVDGWLRTGDVARIDQEGYIWLLDRKKDIIITGGENIFPVEIENFLIKHERIQDVAVIGLPDDRLGEVVAAVVQVMQGQQMTAEEVKTLCELLPRYRRPRHVFFDAVPRNPTGKIEKPVLRKKYAGMYGSFKRGS